MKKAPIDGQDVYILVTMIPVGSFSLWCAHIMYGRGDSLGAFCFGAVATLVSALATVSGVRIMAAVRKRS